MVDYDSLPICDGCKGRYEPKDADWLFPGLCCTCGSNRIDALIRDLVTAKGKPARRKALAAIERLAI